MLQLINDKNIITFITFKSPSHLIKFFLVTVTFNAEELFTSFTLKSHFMLIMELIIDATISHLP